MQPTFLDWARRHQETDFIFRILYERNNHEKVTEMPAGGRISPLQGLGFTEENI